MKNQANSERLKSLLSFIQTYFSQLLFIPLLFGGVVQIILLFQISPQAIRFFSPTQAIADGLFFLTAILLYIISIVLVIVVTLMYGFGTGSARKPISDENTTENVTENKVHYKYSHEQMPFIIHIIMFFAVFYIYYMLFVRNPQTLIQNGTDMKFLLVSGFFTVLLNFALSITLMRFIYFKKEYYFKENQNIFLALNIFLCFICVLCFSVNSSKNSNFVGNFQHLKEKYCCENSGEIDIVYYNDKYIFIRRKCANENEEIVIDKFESFFESKSSK